ncbi:MAG: type II toxin-antitoxin system HicB family antitoxin [Candidatus Berkelbacteria bacterium]|nr:type II toxin-antitoxin system HicB family antitoxin [Candidatus Berkelbacteria bacterium]
MKQLAVSLPVSIFKEGQSFVAYTPALDLSTFGVSIEEARKNFTEATELFFEETERMGTTEEALLSLGWEKQGAGMYPPLEVGHILEQVSVPIR